MNSPVRRPDFTTAALLVNAKARRGREWHRQAEASLRSLGVELGTSRCHSSVRRLVESCRREATSGTQVVFVGGGDGTLSAVAPLFRESASALGVLPMGTGNSFARDLGIESHIPRACQSLVEGKLVPVDLAEIGGQAFLNVATLGVTTDIAAALDPSSKRRWGRLVYVAAMLGALAKARPFQVTFRTEDGEESFDSLQVVLANGRFHGGPFVVAPHAGPSKGHLVLYGVEGRSRAAFLRYGLSLMSGKHVDLPNVRLHYTSSGEVLTTPRRRVTVDGEIRVRTPVTYRVLPGSITALVPSSYHP